VSVVAAWGEWRRGGGDGNCGAAASVAAFQRQRPEGAEVVAGAIGCPVVGREGAREISKYMWVCEK